jgi:hypothetical protein
MRATRVAKLPPGTLTRLFGCGGESMALVGNPEVVEREVGRWLPTDVAFIRRFDFENCSSGRFDLVLLVLVQPRPPLSVGWPDPCGSFWEVEIAFQEVRDLSFTIHGPWDVQCPGFDIEDISDRQWEGVKLLVYDYEAEPVGAPIRFGAKSAAIRSCQPAQYGPNSPMLTRQYPGEFGGE